jgi:hypothetical protein
LYLKSHQLRGKLSGGRDESEPSLASLGLDRKLFLLAIAGSGLARGSASNLNFLIARDLCFEHLRGDSAALSKVCTQLIGMFLKQFVLAIAYRQPAQ